MRKTCLFLYTSCLTGLPRENSATINIVSILLLEGHVDLSAQHDIGGPQVMTLLVLLVLFYHPRKGGLGLQKKSVPLGCSLAPPSVKPSNLYPIPSSL